MSGFPRHNPHDHQEERREDRYERRDEHREQKHGGYDEREQYHPQQRTNYESPAYPPPQSAYQAHPRGGYQDQGGYHSQSGYQAPPGPPPSGRGDQHDRDFGRDDFASDTEFDRMMASGAFTGDRRDRDRYGASEREPQRERYGQRENERYGEREPQRGEYGRYDAPPGPPQGRQYDRDSYGSSGRQQYAPPSEAPAHYGQQTQGRGQYGGGESRGRDNAPAGAFTASGGYGTSRDEEDRYGGPTARRGEEPPRRGEADSYYKSESQSGKGNNPYSHLAGMAHAHGEGDDDHDVYHQATQGLHERIQSRPQRADEEPDYKAHADAHRKAYGDEDSHGPLDANTIGAAAAMEAIKQTVAASGGAPSGGFLGSKSGGGASRPQAKEDEEEADTAAARGSGGGLQDKVMALAMSQAGKLFDKKNGGSASASGGGKPQDKAQAMQSAAATAMQLFAQYQTKGKVETSDVMGLAMKFL